MSGQDIIIEQLREELEKAHAASEYQARRIEHYRTQLDFCERRAEKAERELDRLRSDAKTLAAEHFAADYRAAIARADKAEDERDEARAERDARPDISAEDAALVQDVSGLVGVSRVYRALMVHAAKAVRP